MAANVAGAVTTLPIRTSFRNETQRNRFCIANSLRNRRLREATSSSFVLACVPSPHSQSPTSSFSAKPTSAPSTKLYVSGSRYEVPLEDVGCTNLRGYVLELEKAGIAMQNCLTI
ncbi:organelle RRM domain-containing protein 6, chloroplastic-like [Senna tora]|uniref:Organelle RRM domain-containing protein 6, chloroplastic-like n=1 Tax=Senna tora TaxID=362788 RepID=A0A834WM92_9FABA|nr:organelle RRM domain-containing protein 6, chloroplastic-like [Senna tora]